MQTLRNHVLLEIVVSSFLIIASTVTAILFHFPYFYSTFVIGMFLLFDGIDYLLEKKTFLDIIFPFITLKNALLFVLLGLCIDGLFGRLIFHMWAYPFYTNIVNDVLLYCSVYPVGGLSLIAMYDVFSYLLGRKNSDHTTVSTWLKNLVKTFLIIDACLYPLAFILPIILFFLGDIDPFMKQKLAFGIFIVVLMSIWACAFDIITLFLHGKPFLIDMLTKIYVIPTIFLTGIIAGVIHEYINTYAFEWRYVANRLPFTSFQLFNIPFIVFLGWILGVMLCASCQRAVVTGIQSFLRKNS